MAFDDTPTKVRHTGKAERMSGRLDSQFDEDKLMKSVLQNDKTTINDGRLLNEAINQGIVAFTPDLMFSQIVKNYRMAESLYGPKLIKLLTSYNPDYIRKNIAIPEFNRELQTHLKEHLEQLKDDGLLSPDGQISPAGISLASFVLYMEELDHLLPHGQQGERFHKNTSHYGEPRDQRHFRKGDRYKDLALRHSIRLSIKRQHTHLLPPDLQTHRRHSKGTVYIIYGLDASGSMKGTKIDMAKKAGIALAHAAIMRKDKAGLVVFGSTIKTSIAPTHELRQLAEAIVSVQPSRQTDFTGMIQHAIELFPSIQATKHIILLTDALPTVGTRPEEETLHAVSTARAHGITLSLVGINLDAPGRGLAEKIVRLGEGRLSTVRNIAALDRMVIEDYYHVA